LSGENNQSEASSIASLLFWSYLTQLHNKYWKKIFLEENQFKSNWKKNFNVSSFKEVTSFKGLPWVRAVIRDWISFRISPSKVWGSNRTNGLEWLSRMNRLILWRHFETYLGIFYFITFKYAPLILKFNSIHLFTTQHQDTQFIKPNAHDI